MKITDDLYVYPWTSYQENNCNTVFIDGEVPTLIDPGHRHLFNHIIEGMARDGKAIDRVKSILCTHSHPDHIEAISSFDKEILKGISREEYEYLHNGGKELFLATGCHMPQTPFKLFLQEGMVKLGDKTLQIIPTPGHSPGSVCFYWEEKKALISGDTVFYMGVGRTDFQGGDINALANSVEKLSGLKMEYLIPGHGEILNGEEAISRNFKLILEEFFDRH
ncbi:MAG: MBL fold metallo-hydrolase [Proteobacteria bacterium]|nr:MBL fold metallo-hydrolase [Pseudomonadota bacterium]